MGLRLAGLGFTIIRGMDYGAMLSSQPRVASSVGFQAQPDLDAADEPLPKPTTSSKYQNWPRLTSDISRSNSSYRRCHLATWQDDEPGGPVVVAGGFSVLMWPSGQKVNPNADPVGSLIRTPESSQQSTPKTRGRPPSAERHLFPEAPWMSLP